MIFYKKEMERKHLSIDMKYLPIFLFLNFLYSWTCIQMVKYGHGALGVPIKDDFFGEVKLALITPAIPVVILTVSFYVFYIFYKQIKVFKGE